MGSELPIVVEFKSELCFLCILMKPVIAAVALEHRDTFAFAKLDVNNELQKTSEYHIRGTPTYIVFKDGEMIGTFVGAMSSSKLVRQILGILGIEETE